MPTERKRPVCRGNSKGLEVDIPVGVRGTWFQKAVWLEGTEEPVGAGLAT